MIDDFTLACGVDIPFRDAALTIHNPSLKELSILGLDGMMQAINIFNFTKEKFIDKDKINLINQSDFDIFMSIMCVPDESLESIREKIYLLSAILFPNYTCEFTPTAIILTSLDRKEVKFINEINFSVFKQILSDIFCLNRKGETDDKNYNPQGKLATNIAKKLEERKKKLSQIKKDRGEKEDNVFKRYIFNLSVGLKIDINVVTSWTLYQFYEELDKFQKKESYDMYIDAKLAGASGMKDVDNWML